MRLSAFRPVMITFGHFFSGAVQPFFILLVFLINIQNAKGNAPVIAMFDDTGIQYLERPSFTVTSPCQ
jgi:hypothetical protein